MVHDKGMQTTFLFGSRENSVFFVCIGFTFLIVSDVQFVFLDQILLDGGEILVGQSRLNLSVLGYPRAAGVLRRAWVRYLVLSFL